jgi:hypothetical protein
MPIRPLPLAWLLAAITALLCPGTAMQAAAADPPAPQAIMFDILRSGKVLGHVTALMSEKAGHKRYLMTSSSEFSLGWKQRVNTLVSTEYMHGELIACHSRVLVNKSLRDSSLMARGSGRCYVYPEQPFTCERSSQWSTARMYFEEPLGQRSVFVESVLRDLPLERTGPGTYTLTFPDGKRNHYIYAAGELREIQVERTFFTLVFRRR